MYVTSGPQHLTTHVSPSRAFPLVDQPVIAGEAPHVGFLNAHTELSNLQGTCGVGKKHTFVA